uniref:Uncharacterized protein n=1 Tax=Anguilla anguilla TaxID=7936 RepID=A0A0E9UTR8_ANGAN
MTTENNSYEISELLCCCWYPTCRLEGWAHKSTDVKEHKELCRRNYTEKCCNFLSLKPALVTASQALTSPASSATSQAQQR